MFGLHQAGGIGQIATWWLHTVLHFAPCKGPAYPQSQQLSLIQGPIFPCSRPRSEQARLRSGSQPLWTLRTPIFTILCRENERLPVTSRDLWKALSVWFWRLEANPGPGPRKRPPRPGAGPENLPPSFPFRGSEPSQGWRPRRRRPCSQLFRSAIRDYFAAPWYSARLGSRSAPRCSRAPAIRPTVRDCHYTQTVWWATLRTVIRIIVGIKRRIPSFPVPECGRCGGVRRGPQASRARDAGSGWGIDGSLRGYEWSPLEIVSQSRTMAWPKGWWLSWSKMPWFNALNKSVQHKIETEETQNHTR